MLAHRFYQDRHLWLPRVPSVDWHFQGRLQRKVIVTLLSGEHLAFTPHCHSSRNPSRRLAPKARSLRLSLLLRLFLGLPSGQFLHCPGVSAEVTTDPGSLSHMELSGRLADKPESSMTGVWGGHCSAVTKLHLFFPPRSRGGHAICRQDLRTQVQTCVVFLPSFQLKASLSCLLYQKVFFCVCACAHVRMCVYLFAHTCGGQRWISSSVFLCGFEKTFLTDPRAHSFNCQLVSELQRAPCSCHPRAGIINTCHSSWRPNSGPPACTASFSPAEPSACCASWRRHLSHCLVGHLFLPCLTV